MSCYSHSNRAPLLLEHSDYSTLVTSVPVKSHSERIIQSMLNGSEIDANRS